MNLNYFMHEFIISSISGRKDQISGAYIAIFHPCENFAEITCSSQKKPLHFAAAQTVKKGHAEQPEKSGAAACTSRLYFPRAQAAGKYYIQSGRGCEPGFASLLQQTVLSELKFRQHAIRPENLREGVYARLGRANRRFADRSCSAAQP